MYLTGYRDESETYCRYSDGRACAIHCSRKQISFVTYGNSYVLPNSGVAIHKNCKVNILSGSGPCVCPGYHRVYRATKNPCKITSNNLACISTCQWTPKTDSPLICHCQIWGYENFMREHRHLDFISFSKEADNFSVCASNASDQPQVLTVAEEFDRSHHPLDILPHLPNEDIHETRKCSIQLR